MEFLIGIGAQKSGTSWLANYFESHEEVFMSPIKELHFFDEKHVQKMHTNIRREKYNILRNKITKTPAEKYTSSKADRDRIVNLFDWVNLEGDIKKYREFFEKRAPQGVPCCEITPSYSMLSESGFRDIKSLSESVKIIFSIRNPIERFWSALRMAEDSGHASIENDFDKWLNSEGYTLRGNYQRTHEELKKVFDKKDVHIVFYENLFDDKSVEGLCKFCNISYKKAQKDKINETKNQKKITETQKRLVYDKYKSIYQWAVEEFDSLPSNWVSDMEKYESVR